MFDSRRQQVGALAFGGLLALLCTVIQLVLEDVIHASRAQHIALLLAIFISVLLPLMVAEAYFEVMARMLVERAAAISGITNILLWLMLGGTPVVVAASTILAQLLSLGIYYEAAGYVVEQPPPIEI